MQQVRIVGEADMKGASYDSASVTNKQEHALQHTLRMLFPHTISAPLVHFAAAAEAKPSKLLRVGVVLSGGQAPGGHNVISGLFDALRALNPESELIGFRDGPAGIVRNQYIRLTEELVGKYRNQGGFDIIGSGRDKIESASHLAAAKSAMEAHDLDGLVVIGGDDSNTNAMLMAESFKATGCKTAVVGVPKTIDGDLSNEHIEISFGYDTACKTYSHEIGDIARDCRSARKYWFFIKLMGRSASHITLECALQTRPNIALISEEVAEKERTLADVAREIADIVQERSRLGKNYGVCLIPEGLIEFIPEFKLLISNLNKLLSIELHTAVLKALKKPESKVEYVISLLSGATKACYESLPIEIQMQLILDRDSHGNVVVSQIETEKLVASMVAVEMAKRKASGSYKGEFNPIYHFCGYQGRANLPSIFDSDYCYTLGHTAVALVANGCTGYLSCVSNLAHPSDRWIPKGIPIVSLLNIEERKGKPKPVIRKALVNLEGSKFLLFAKHRSLWAVQDAYIYPGPIQFWGPRELTHATNFHVRSFL